jgi:hypothetical protein
MIVMNCSSRKPSEGLIYDNKPTKSSNWGELIASDTSRILLGILLLLLLVFA